MSDTAYIDFNNPAVLAAWLNDVNKFTYRGLPLTYAVDTGPANALAISLPSSNIAALADGMTFWVKVGHTNTITNPTLTITTAAGALAPVQIYRQDGSSLYAGDLVGGQIIPVTYNSGVSGLLWQNGLPINAIAASGVFTHVTTTDILVGGNYLSPYSLRNRLINGDMRIDQRNSGAAQTIVNGAAAAYTVDRWYATCAGANVTGQRVAGATPNQYNYQFTGAASVTGIAFGQRIEATNILDLTGTIATLSVDLADSLLTTVNWAAYYPTATDNWTSRTLIASGSFTVNSTLTRYSTQITLGANITAGLEIEFSVGAQTSGTLTIGRVQLEPGSVATFFERRPIGLETALCQRYYYNLPANSTSTYIASAWAYAATDARCILQLPVPMRILPASMSSFSATQCSAQLGGTNFTSTAIAYQPANSSPNAAQIDLTIAGATVGQGGSIFFNTASGFIGLTAEL